MTTARTTNKKEWSDDIRLSLVVVSVLVMFMVVPQTTHAGIVSFFQNLFTTEVEADTAPASTVSMTTLEAANNLDPVPNKTESETVVASETAVMSESGPVLSNAEVDNATDTGQISLYTVRKGDTLSAIAKMFGVTTNTILWANDISANSLKEGMNLVILPISGLKYTVKKGDTIKSIAAKYKADFGEVISYNGLKVDEKLAVGDELIIPNAEFAIIPYTAKPTIPGASKNPTWPLKGYNVPAFPGYYIKPVICPKSQGLHGWNAVDLACNVGTPIKAPATGVVIVARSTGWNGGYGKYIVVSHANGTQTLFGHLSNVSVIAGQTVIQGETIGNTGNTGNSTGPHLHFEIRGGKQVY